MDIEFALDAIVESVTNWQTGDTVAPAVCTPFMISPEGQRACAYYLGE